MLLEKEARNHLYLARERDELVKTIRTTIPGFENFLLPPSCPILLQDLPASGPVVILNVHALRCDALVLLAGMDEPFPIHLPDFSAKKASEYAEAWALHLSSRGIRKRSTYTREELYEDDPRAVRAFKGRDRGQLSAYAILENLWKEVVRPVLQALGFPVSQVAS